MRKIQDMLRPDHPTAVSHDVTDDEGEENNGRIEGRDVPCTAIETQPGDVILMSHHCFHASFGGGPSRPHFCLNLSRRATTELEMQELDRWIVAKGAGALPTDAMLETAGAEQARHLQQVVERAEFLSEAHPDLREYAR
jgi:hypothetical protein